MVGSLVTSSPMWSKTTEFPSAGGLTETSRPRERFDGRTERASHVADQEMLAALDHWPSGHEDIDDIVRAGGKYGRFQK